MRSGAASRSSPHHSRCRKNSVSQKLGVAKPGVAKLSAKKLSAKKPSAAKPSAKKPVQRLAAPFPALTRRERPRLA